MAQLQYTKMDAERFCVWQRFSLEGAMEKVRDWCVAREAVEAAKHYATSVAARNGLVEEVLIADSGYMTVWHWTFYDGIVFPTEFKSKLKRGIGLCIMNLLSMF